MNNDIINFLIMIEHFCLQETVLKQEAHGLHCSPDEQ